MVKRKSGKHRVRRPKNPYERDVKTLESYGKGLAKQKFEPLAKPQFPKVTKPKNPRMPPKPKMKSLW